MMTLDSSIVDDFTVYMDRYIELYRDFALVIDQLIPQNLSKPTIVDIGAGPGFLVRELQYILPYAKIIAVDPSYLMLRYAEKNILRRDYLICSKGEYLPLNNSSVDIIVSRFSLPYWNTPSHVFKEIYRVLKPSGKIILEALNADYPRWKLWFIKIHMLLKRAPRTVIEYHIDAYKNAYTIRQIKNNVMNNGFKVIKVEEKQWFFRFIAEKT